MKQSASIGFLQSLVGRLGVIGVTAFTGVLSARVLRPAGRGELAAMILWPVFLSCALTFGIPAATVYRLKHDPTLEPEVVGTGLLLSMLAGVLAFVIGWIFMPIWLVQYSAGTVFYARVLLLNTIPCAMVLTGRASLESRGEFRLASILLLVPCALTLVWLVSLAVSHRLTPVNAAVAYITTTVPSFVYMMCRLYRDVHPKFARLLRNSRSLLSYGIRAYGVDLCGTLSLYVDQGLVVRMLSPELMGIYVTALSLSRILNVFHLAVIAVLFPRAVAQDPERVMELTGRAVRISTLLTLTCGAGIGLFGHQLLWIVYGPRYAAAGGLLDILTLEVVLSGVALVLSQAFMALGRPGVVTVFQTTGLLLTIPLLLVFVPRWGLIGAGSALLCSTTIRLSFVVFGFRFLLNRRCPRLITNWNEITALVAQVGAQIRIVRMPATLKATD